MAANPEIKVTIEGESSGFSKAIDSAKKNLDELGSSADKASKKAADFRNRLNGLGTYATLAASAAAYAFAKFGVSAVKAAADMEQSEIAFTTMLGSADKAKAMLSELADFAGHTPFDMPGVVDGSRRLLAMGFSAQQVIPMMTAIGDAAAGLGLGSEGINRLTLAFGQMAAKGKIASEEMTRQLAEAGIPAWDMLAKKIGVSVPEAMKMVEKGSISAGTGIQAIISGMNEKFGGMMEKQAKTTSGLWANMEDNITRTMIKIGNSITEAFDLKTKMQGILKFLDEFREKIEQGGIRKALQEVFPPGLKTVIAGIAGAIGGVAVAAIAAFTVAMGGAVAAAAPFIAVGTALGIAAEFIWTNWDDLARNWRVIWSEIVRQTANGTSNVVVTVTEMVDTVADGWQKLMSLMGHSSEAASGMKEWAKGWRETADAAKTAAEAEAAAANMAWREGNGKQAAPLAAEKPNIDIDNLGLNFGAGLDTAAKASKAAAAKIQREIDRIKEGLNTLGTKAADVQTSFQKLQLDNAFGALDGAAKVHAEVWKPVIDEALRYEEQIKKIGLLQKEAQDLLGRSQKTGDSKQIAAAEKQITDLANLQVETAAYTKNRIEQLKVDAADKEKDLYTKVAATKAEMDIAMQEGDMARFYAALDEKSLAEMTAMSEKQAAMQAYFDWEMESRQTMQEWALQAMETLKQGVAASFANAVTGGENLGKALANVGKQIANMFIQWQVSRAIAGAFAAMQDKKDSTKKISALKAEATVAWDLALAYTIAHPGAGLRGLSEVSLAKTGGAALSAVPVPGAANGAFVNSPTLTLVGEGRYPEGIFPLGGPVFDRFFAPLMGGGGSQVTAVQNNYGDINNSSDLHDLMEGFSDNLMGALRGA